MPYCLNPACGNPHNPQHTSVCHSCNATLMLKNRYWAIQPLSQGGFGRTFLAVDEDLPLKPQCVIKQLHLQDENMAARNKAVQLFKQEALRLQALGEHPQIPRLLAYCEQDQQLYLIQELIAGKSLIEESWQENGEQEHKIWELLTEILPVLQYIHEREVIHRDIKPDNIMRRSIDGKLVLIDFGIARLLTKTALLGGATVVGTPEYMAPEQTRGKVLPASDLYSLGVTCLRMLTGVSTMDMFDIFEERWLWREHLPEGVEVSAKLGKILDRLLHPSPRQRYRSAKEALKAVNSAIRLLDLVGKSEKVQPSERFSSGFAEQFASTRWIQRQEAVTLPAQEDTELIPEVQVDYNQLKSYLSRGKWQQADEETWSIMSQLLGKQAHSHLSYYDLQNLPCPELELLDLLWVKYSRGKFGFSVQARLYEEVGGEYPQFCELVGWLTYQPKKLAQAFNFSLKAPVGHLPSRCWLSGYHWWRHTGVMAEKIRECGIR